MFKNSDGILCFQRGEAVCCPKALQMKASHKNFVTFRHKDKSILSAGKGDIIEGIRDLIVEFLLHSNCLSSMKLCQKF